MDNVLTYQEAEDAYAQLKVGERVCEEEDVELYTDLYERAARYAGFRAGWLALSREQKMETDASRTSAHDAFLVSLNVIARLQGAAGVGWRERLGDERKRLGDFACYITLFRALEAR